jgi:hypothetical protein
VTDAAPKPDPDPREAEEEAHARRLYVRALAWGVLTLVFLFWFSRHWRV